MNLPDQRRLLPGGINNQGSGILQPSSFSGQAGGDAFYSATKRLLDLTLSAMLIILLSPAMLYIAYLIKKQDGGPVFYRQERHGLDGKTFSIFKFRSMTVAASTNQFVQCRQGDSRVTELGRILRKTSLDELPQLFNVFGGTMSLVGPRPHAVTHDFEFCGVLDHYAQRYSVTPGMTGLAQVRGKRGETKDLGAMAARLALDLEYVERASLWLDVSILLGTFAVVLKGDNAL